MALSIFNEKGWIRIDSIIPVLKKSETPYVSLWAAEHGVRKALEGAFGSAAHFFKSSTSFGASVNDRLFFAMKESIMLSIFAVRSTRGMSLGGRRWVEIFSRIELFGWWWRWLKQGGCIFRVD